MPVPEQCAYAGAATACQFEAMSKEQLSVQETSFFWEQIKHVSTVIVRNNAGIGACNRFRHSSLCTLCAHHPSIVLLNLRSIHGNSRPGKSAHSCNVLNRRRRLYDHRSQGLGRASPNVMRQDTHQNQDSVIHNVADFVWAVRRARA